MPYVSRDDSSNITGCYANRQPGFAEEWLEDDDPEIIAFLEASKPQTPRDPNTRLDDGVKAAQDIMSQPLPPPVPSSRAVGQEEFDALKAQVDQLSAAMKAMLEGHGLPE